MDNEKAIRDFVAAWSRLDPAELAGFFADDGVYHNMPAAPVQGRENIEQMIAGFISPWTHTDWEILNLVADGDLAVPAPVGDLAGEVAEAQRSRPEGGRVPAVVAVVIDHGLAAKGAADKARELEAEGAED